MNNRTIFGDKEPFNWFECVAHEGNLYEKTTRLVSEIRRYCPAEYIAICLTSESNITILYNNLSTEYAAKLSYYKLHSLYKNASTKPCIDKDGSMITVYQSITYDKNVIGFFIYLLDKSKVTAANTWYIKNNESMVMVYHYLCLEKMLLEQSRLDSLTGCLNEVELREKLGTAIGSTDKQLAVININGFNQINTQYGYDVGNSILREIAHLLMTVIGQQDYLFRLFDDKFAILMNGNYHVGFKQLLDIKNLIENNEFTNIHNSNYAIKIMLTIGVVDLAREINDQSVDNIYKKVLIAGQARKNGINYSDEKVEPIKYEQELLCNNSVPIRRNRNRKAKKDNQEEREKELGLFEETTKHSNSQYFRIFNM